MQCLISLELGDLHLFKDIILHVSLRTIISACLIEIVLLGTSVKGQGNDTVKQ